MMLEIDRLWNQSPGWSTHLEPSEQARLIAWYRVGRDRG